LLNIPVEQNYFLIQGCRSAIKKSLFSIKNIKNYFELFLKIEYPGSFGIKWRTHADDLENNYVLTAEEALLHC
jgi:hypothetical protein